MKRLTCEAVAKAVLGLPQRIRGDEWVYRCAHHERHKNGDVHPSLFINAKKDVFLCGPCGVSGKAWKLAAFIAGLEAGDKPTLTAWLRERGLLNGKRPAQSKKATSADAECKRVITTYEHHDASGNPVARLVRYEPKSFSWQRWEDGAWIDGLASVKVPLYRSREIASEPSVVLTEGSKDADEGAKLGLATTTSGGTGSFRLDHADALRGKHVCITADADPPGREEAQKRAAMLYGKARCVKVVEFPGAKDLAEAIEKGLTLAAFLDLLDQAPDWRPVAGDEILHAVRRFIRRFLALSEDQVTVIVLWEAHTHALGATDCTPYLGINSPEKGSGKTRALEVLEILVAKPWLTGRVTAAVLTRKIDAVGPTLLLDESDAAFGAEKEYAEALRGILNTGYRRGGVASCCVGQGANIGFKDFSTFCPKAIAGIGKLPDTVADRSIPIQLKRAKSGEVQRFRKREVEREATEINGRIAAWCAANVEKLREARPDIPPELSDRQADCCEPLLAIADLAGGDWPEKARIALVALCAAARREDDSNGVRLLTDIRQIFEGRGVDRIASEDLVEALLDIETSPWGEWSHEKPITKPKLARLLGRFDVHPDSIRFGTTTRKGYLLSDFEDSFCRYLPAEKRNNGTGPINIGPNGLFENGTGPVCSGPKNPQNANKNAARSVVPVPTVEIEV